MSKEKDGNNYIEYQNDEISSSICQAILKQAYVMFRLFMGSFNTIINEPECGSTTLLKHKLEHFYSRVNIQSITHVIYIFFIILFVLQTYIFHSICYP